MSRGAHSPMGWTVGDGGGLGGRTARKSALGGLHTAHHDFATAHRELTIYDTPIVIVSGPRPVQENSKFVHEGRARFPAFSRAPFPNPERAIATPWGLASRTSPVESGCLRLGAEARAEHRRDWPAASDANQTTAQLQPFGQVSSGKLARSLRHSQVCTKY